MWCDSRLLRPQARHQGGALERPHRRTMLLYLADAAAADAAAAAAAGRTQSGHRSSRLLARPLLCCKSQASWESCLAESYQLMGCVWRTAVANPRLTRQYLLGHLQQHAST